MKVYVKLFPHSEYEGFSEYDGVYPSLQAAIDSELNYVNNKLLVDNVKASTTKEISVLKQQIKNKTYVMIFGWWVDEKKLNSIKDEFEFDPIGVSYAKSSNSFVSFCVVEADV